MREEYRKIPTSVTVAILPRNGRRKVLGIVSGREPKESQVIGKHPLLSLVLAKQQSFISEYEDRTIQHRKACRSWHLLGDVGAAEDE